MASTEGIVGALAHLGETTDAAVGADGLKRFTPAGEYLMWIGLVPHIPNQFIIGGVEDIMQGNGELCLLYTSDAADE